MCQVVHEHSLQVKGDLAALLVPTKQPAAAAAVAAPAVEDEDADLARRLAALKR
jgi:hypothetical protein